MIDRSLVIEVYRALLKREPESEAVVASAAASVNSLEELLRNFLQCSEFRAKAANTYIDLVKEQIDRPPGVIEFSADADQEERLIQRTINGWTALGEADPYWSVLTNEAYRNSNITESRKEEFFRTGKYYADLIEMFERKSNFKAAKNVCFELGCGVGRVTFYLSKIFKEVIASDISEGNLRICKDYLTSMGVKNVKYVLIKSIRDYEKAPPFDFLYSFIVLQHNTPPVQKYLIETLTSKINKMGGCLIQTPAYLPGYSFKIGEYLSNKNTAAMEMHAIPMHVVLNIFKKNGLDIQMVVPDQFTGLPESYTYFASK